MKKKINTDNGEHIARNAVCVRSKYQLQCTSTLLNLTSWNTLTLWKYIPTVKKFQDWRAYQLYCDTVTAADVQVVARSDLSDRGSWWTHDEQVTQNGAINNGGQETATKCFMSQLEQWTNMIQQSIGIYCTWYQYLVDDSTDVGR